MNDYATTTTCRMIALRRYLDDPEGEACGRCDVCTRTSLAIDLPPATVQEAVAFLRSTDVVIEPRKQLPNRQRIPADRQPSPGRALSVWDDGGWGRLVRRGKQVTGRFDDQLVEASVDLIRQRWRPDPFPCWVTFVPSLLDPGLLAGFSPRLAESLGVPCEPVVAKVRDTEPQKKMQNSLQQYRNVRGAYEVTGPVPAGPVVLVADTIDSRWTVTAIAWKLLEAGSGPVYPFALADTAGRSL